MGPTKENLGKNIQIPGFVRTILERLHSKGYQAYVVGGAVRDVCMRQPVDDWDVATSATPGKIKSIFKDVRSFSLKHETVTLVEKRRQYEVTCFRGSEGRGRSLVEDLSHRDFTINAMAYDAARKMIIDPHGGRKDISHKRVKTVGDPRERFREDPLRLMRGVRIATELGFNIAPETSRTMIRMAGQLGTVAKERIRYELIKILMSENPSRGLGLLRQMSLLKEFLPEILEGYRRKQNSYHEYTIFRHVMETVDRVTPYPVLRLAALLHDVAKPRCREKRDGEFRFPGHETASAMMARDIMMRLKFSREMTHEVTHLIRHHLPVTKYETPWSDEMLRRLVRRVGPQYIRRFLVLSRADLLAHGEHAKKLGVLSDLEERALRIIQKPLTLKTRQLAIDGEKVMEIFGLPPGPKVGRILDYLMERVTDHPEMNTADHLIALLEELDVGQKAP